MFTQVFSVGGREYLEFSFLPRLSGLWECFFILEIELRLRPRKKNKNKTKLMCPRRYLCLIRHDGRLTFQGVWRKGRVLHPSPYFPGLPWTPWCVSPSPQNCQKPLVFATWRNIWGALTALELSSIKSHPRQEDSNLKEWITNDRISNIIRPLGPAQFWVALPQGLSSQTVFNHKQIKPAPEKLQVGVLWDDNRFWNNHV